MIFFNIWIYLLDLFIGFIGFLSTKGQHVAELVQRTQQLVPDVQQVGSQRCGHALQVLLVVLYLVLQCGQRVERPHAQLRQVGTRVFGTQQLLHKAVHLLGQRLVQVVGGFVHRIAVRAPVVQLYHDHHFRHRGHHVVDAILIDSLTMAFIVVLMGSAALMALSVALSYCGRHLIVMIYTHIIIYFSAGFWGLTTMYSGLNGAILSGSSLSDSSLGC